MSVANTIEEKLIAAFGVDRLKVENESAKHAGHAGMERFPSAATGETHFRVTIVSPDFEGKSLVERHRAINAVLKDELSGPVHALAIKALTPAEESPKI